MKMKYGLLILALFSEIALHSTTPFSFQEAFLLEGRRVKREQCQHGVYDYNGENCCKCPRGYYVKTNCGNGARTECEQCQENTYYEEPNSRMECERCRSCNANVHQKTEEICTNVQNTKCKCMEGYWGVCQDTCQCHPCDKCKGKGILASCTDKNNTLCGDPTGDIYHKRIILSTVTTLVLVLVLVLVVVVVLVVCLWKKRMVCFSDKETCPVQLTEFERLPLMQDVDLSNYLYEIVEELGPQLVKELAVGSGVKEAQIQMHINEHPHNTKEQYYGILRDWYQKKGLKQAFPELMKFLQRNGKTANAERLKNVIIPQTEETACVNMDNPGQPA